MEKKRGNQIMAIAALFIAVIGLSLGFAAFSNTLTISSSATVTPNSNVLNVDFSNATSFTTKPYTPLLNYDDTELGSTNGVAEVTTTGSPAPTYTRGTFNNDTDKLPTLSGLQARFTEPGQSVTYTFYAYNVGELAAYLRQIKLGSDNTARLSCAADAVTSPDTPATDSLVQAACNDMVVSLDVQEASGNASLIGGAKTITKAANGSDNAINIDSIIPGVAHKVVLTIAYNLDSNANAGAGNRPDGPMTVTIPDIQLVYESVSYNEANGITP